MSHSNTERLPDAIFIPSSNSKRSWNTAKTRTEKITSIGIECDIHVWSPSPHHHYCDKSAKPRGIVCVYHDIPGSIHSPAEKYLIEFLSSYNYIVYGMDFPAHGKSKSKKGSPVKDIIQHGVNTAFYASEKHPDLPIFLSGTGAGGTIALLVSNSIQDNKSKHIANRVSGMILFVPLIASHDVSSCLNMFSCRKGKIAPLKSSTPKGKDTLNIDVPDFMGGSKRFSQTIKQLTSLAYKSLHLTSKPFICLVERDNLTSHTENMRNLMHHTASNDKKLYIFKDTIDDTGVNMEDVTDLKNLVPLKNKARYEFGGDSFVTYSSLFLHDKKSFYPRRQKMEVDVISWLHARTIGVQYFPFYSSLLRSDSETRRKAVLDELEDVFFS